MAKETQVAAPSWADFDETNLLETSTEVEEQEEESQEEEIEEEKKPLKKKVTLKKEETQTEEEKPLKKKVKAEAEEETEEEEEETNQAETEKEETEEDDEVNPDKFFEEVEKITGQKVEVEYGDADPLSPQGVAIREQAVRESAVEAFLEEIETKYPVAYKALQHAHNGGDIAELFKAVTARDYSNVVLDEKSTDLAKEILKEYYESKGIKNPKRIERLLKDAEDSDDGIVIEAKGVLEELKTEQTTKADQVVAEQKLKAEKQRKNDSVMVGAVEDVLETGKLDTFKLTSRQETAEFKKFVLANLRRKGDGFELATSVDPANLEKLLQYQYFQFKKGDLGKLIQIKAGSEQAKKMVLKLRGEQGTKKKGSGQERSTEQQQSLKDFDVD